MALRPSPIFSTNLALFRDQQPPVPPFHIASVRIWLIFRVLGSSGDEDGGGGGVSA